MLNLSKTTIDRSRERPLTAGVVLTKEGQAMIGVTTAGAFGVKPSTGASGEKFLGVSFSQIGTIDLMPKVETLVIPASGAATVTLAETPSGGTIRIYNTSNSTEQTTGNPGTTDNRYSIAGNVITFHTDRGGDTVVISYKYVPTVAEVSTIQGDAAPGIGASAALSSTGLIEAGDVYTTEYDTAADWSAEAPVVKLAANGQFTTTGSGTTLTNVTVIQVPTDADPLLGLHIA